MSPCSVCHQDVWFLKSCGKCHKKLCSTCCNYALADRNRAVTGCCRDCFRGGVTLDLSVHTECYGPPKGSAVCVLLVHGGGGSRAMYRRLAKFLASEGGYRCVLPDLPGHGGRMDESLSPQSCVAAIQAAVEQETAPFDGIRPFYLGGSFGGAVAMHTVNVDSSLFSGMIMACCAQNTGVGAGLAARVTLSALRFNLEHFMSSSTMVGLMMATMKRAVHLDMEHVMNTGVLTGMYFHRGVEQVDVLRTVNPVANMSKYDGPVLYLNGSDDHRDTLEALVKCSHHELTRSILYPKGDHFFSHDMRFQEDFERDVLRFMNDVCQSLRKTRGIPNK